jgi:predicted phosphodiesterase
MTTTMMSSTIRRIVVISDIQTPYEDFKAIRNVANFIQRWKPDDVLCVGDEIDFQTISRWSSGKDEWSQTIGKDRDRTREILHMLKVKHLSRSNHTDRLYKALSLRLPGLIGLPELEYENFMGLKELGITYHRKPYRFHESAAMVHGDEQPIKHQGGATALEASKRHGLSIVCGHTHRLGVTWHTTASGGEITSKLFGLEVGHLMREDLALYTKGTFNWSKGFGIIYIDRKRVIPVAVPIERDGTFVVEGKRYPR